MKGKTVAYIIKRLALAVFTILIVVTITFWLMQLMPGGPFTKEKALSPATIAALNAKYGLDKPLFVQYLVYLGKAFTFDFGPSFKQEGVQIMDIVRSGMRYSLPMGLVAAGLAICAGTALGTLAAVKRGTWVDRLIMILSTASVAFPSFVIAMILVFVFCINIKVFPTDYVNGGFAAFILPTLTLAMSPTAYITRLSRSATLDSLGSDYIITARAKGSSQSHVIFGHVLKNSLAPTVTYAGPMFASIITGSLVIEQVFQIPGIGRSFVTSISNRDYPLLMCTTVILTDLIVIMTLLSDLGYKIINPRVELE